MGQICFRREQRDAGSSSHRLEKVSRTPALLSEVTTVAREQPGRSIDATEVSGRVLPREMAVQR